MRRPSIILGVIMLCWTVAAANAQDRKVTGANVRIEAGKPTVYISFERYGARDPLHAGESYEGVWLRLHNNTRWRIFLPVFGVPEPLGDAGLFYDVEAEAGDLAARAVDYAKGEKSEVKDAVQTPPVGYTLRHSFSISDLKPGETLLFSIPREHLGKGLALRIPFQYEWEGDVTFSGDRPKHYVYFYNSGLL